MTTTTDLEVRLGQRTGPDGPIVTLTLNGSAPFDADQAIAEFRKSGRPDIADKLERFVSDELAEAIHPRRPGKAATRAPVPAEMHPQLAARAAQWGAVRMSEVLYDDDGQVIGDVTYERAPVPEQPAKSAHVEPAPVPAEPTVTVRKVVRDKGEILASVDIENVPESEALAVAKRPLR